MIPRSFEITRKMHQKMMRITWSVADNAPENDENHVVSSFSGALSPTDQMDVKVTNAYTYLICTN